MDTLNRLRWLLLGNSDPCLREIHLLRSNYQSMPRYTPGRLKVFGWDIEFVDGLSMLSSLETLVCRGHNDFLCETDEPIVLDCGANIGISILNYKRKYPKAKITAFEPDPQFVPVLRRNLHRNGIQDVEVIEAAVWTDRGRTRFVLEGADGSHIVAHEGSNQDSVMVDTIWLGDFIGDRVDMIKLDIEGAEYAVIESLGDKLANVRSMIVECHIDSDRISDLGLLLDCLGQAQFQVSINTVGIWRDLIRRPETSADSFDQYALVAAWRSD